MPDNELLPLDTEKTGKIDPLNAGYMTEREKQKTIENAITNTYKLLELHTDIV